ncbi:hypothetical protein KEK_05892 [Mycolicibacterium thermoresistibile ATCC 19527]|jgi:hypothetical protein|uniref:Uncharacterized protein n=2 Tax=Mycolicibacterium thermoresistibile TaxID=1797 RepID=G7CDX0_MYCT3|nr:hypothetical protein KEK_05892 [Mycolicibacterium thermoresistibile ATCC 19527]SNW17978.1 Uncharacterised protein [Mycolicibacterium thermoresistibile]
MVPHMHRRGVARDTAAPGGFRGRRLTGSVVGGLAALAMVVVGCTSLTAGSGQADAEEVPVYRASVSSSIAASAASSSARESERQRSLTRQAVHNSCDALSTSSVDAIRAVNAYVDAFNSTGDVGAKVRPAVDALNHSADLVQSSLSDALTPELRDALTAWTTAAREVGVAIEEDHPTDEFNAGVDRLNQSRALALTLCDAAY